MATAITRLITLMRGEDVGTDGFGNRYYQDRRIPKYGRRRRWVVYNGEDEASRVPPEWHHWLHYTTDEVPTADRQRVVQGKSVAIGRALVGCRRIKKKKT